MPSWICSKVNDVFEKIAKKLPGFEVRDGQLQMFQNVTQSYEEEQTSLIEAGTGTGKSLAYLIPAILWALKKKEPTVIATHTIALQEQLMQKDIPFLLDALEVDLKAVLVKGMNNYVCLRKLYDSLGTVPDSLYGWAKKTVEGSKTELPVVASADLWDQIGAESENCTHMKCPHYKECFFFKARKAAADAQLIVANHHLLFADLAVREETDNYTDSAVLPHFKRLIIDEAHHCEDVATQYFAKKVSKRGLIQSLGRLFSDRGSGKLVTLYAKICEAFPEGDLLRESLTTLLPAEKRQIVDLIGSAFDALSFFITAQKPDEKFRVRQHHLDESFWKERVQPPVDALVSEGKRFVSTVFSLESKLKNVDDPNLDSKCASVLAEIKGICSRLDGALNTLQEFVFSPVEPERVRWIEGNAPDLHLISAELEIDKRLGPSLFEKLPTIVLCSATLSSQKSFSFVRKRLGIKECEENIYPSPFNYKEKTQLTVPIDLPDPAHPQFVQKASESIWEALQICKGGAFVLFTSYSMLRECEKILSPRLHKKHFMLYCQGDDNRSNLLRKFRTTEKAVLFGTDSFWEGVDVAGEALRCVIIVKLPFKVPSEPLFQARSEAIEAQGGSPFFEYSLPHAIVKFKQGFGRLIRNKEDRGCVICLDPRLAKKGYGKKFVESLPECPLVFDSGDKCVDALKAFYAQK